MLQCNPVALLGCGLTEIRVIPKGRKPYSGYFKDPAEAAQAVRAWDGKADVYMTINMLNPNLYFKDNGGKIQQAGTGDSTADKAVVLRMWMLIDFDPERPAGISSTDDEKARAWELLQTVRNDLFGADFTEPVVCDSGNGYHLLYRIDLENTDENTKLVKDFLGCLASQYDTHTVKVDKMVYNAARVVKFYGVMTLKGRNSPERPHRRSGVLEVPQRVEITPRGAIEKYVAEHMPKPETKPVQRQKSASQGEWDLDKWIAEHGVKIKRTEQGNDGGTRYILEDGCPFNPEHKGKDAVLYKRPDGAIGFKCFHNSCSDKRWRDFRLLYEPDAYSKPHRATAEEDFAPVAGREAPKAKLIRMSDITSTSTKWLWYPYIPSGKLTLMQGDPGQGKTMLSLAIAAITSAGGRFLNDDAEFKRRAGTVIYQTAEDGLADTIKPRLEKMSPDFERIYVIDESEEGLTLSDDRIRDALEECKPSLLIIDPLQAYLGSDVDMHRANEVRPVLSKIGHLAEKHDCAILLIMHMSKMTSVKALYRGLGSIDIPAAARSILVVGKDPDNPEQKIMAHEKSSLARNGQSVSFHIDQELGIVFDGYSDLTADDILNGEPKQRQGRPGEALDRAMQMLNELLSPAGYVTTKEVWERAKEEHIGSRTVYRARDMLKLEARQYGFGSSKASYWGYEGALHGGTEEPGTALQPVDIDGPFND